MGEIKHGDARRSGHHRLYSIRKGMLERCYNPNSIGYERYGGRGIKVCEEWIKNYLSFKDWALNSGYEDGLTIDRIDNDGDYCPENCRWASLVTQANNKKSVPKYEYQGESHSISEWARILNMPRELLKDRITRLNWDVEKAFTTPPKNVSLLNIMEKFILGKNGVILLEFQKILYKEGIIQLIGLLKKR